MITIVDISHYEDLVDPSKLKGDGVSGVYLKVAQGTRFVDSMFLKYKKMLEEANVPWGGYHFWEEQTTGGAQAKYMATAMGNACGQLPPVLDFEPFVIGQHPPRLGALSSIQSFMTTIGDIYKTKPLFYTNPDHLMHLLTPIPDWLVEYPLWISNLGVSSPYITPWKSYKMWQYSFSGKIDGINGAVDMNHAQADILGDVTQPVEPTQDEKNKLLWEWYLQNH